MLLCECLCLCKGSNFSCVQVCASVWGTSCAFEHVCECKRGSLCTHREAWELSANYVYWVSLLLTLPKCSNLADAHKQMIYWGETELNKVKGVDWEDSVDKGGFSKRILALNRKQPRVYRPYWGSLYKFCIFVFIHAVQRDLYSIFRLWISWISFTSFCVTGYISFF